jgi:hypothetical protein
MTLPACLVTSSPTFEEPKRTRPFLLAEGSSPDVRQIKLVNTVESLPLEFSATVLSEDAGTEVVGRVVLDYGVAVDGLPFQSLGEPSSVVASTLDDTSRTLTAKWGSTYRPTLGCHYVSLLASHQLPCPEDPLDLDFLTWTVVVCDSSQGPCCDPSAPKGEGDCAPLECPAVDPNVRCDNPAGGVP